MTDLNIPSDGPRIEPRKPEDVNPTLRSEYDKARNTWGIDNNLMRTMGCHPRLAMTEVNYANAFIFDEGVFEQVPKPGRTASSQETVLFPSAGFIDRVTKELVINYVSQRNRSRYSITHHSMIAYGTLSKIVGAEKAEALMTGMVNADGESIFDSQGDLYSSLQLAALRVAEKSNADPHLVTDAEMEALRDELEKEARAQIATGPCGPQFGNAGPDATYVSFYVDAMMVEITWCMVHFGGLLNRWFTLLKVRDEAFPIDLTQDGDPVTFPEAYNATLPDSIKELNNALLGPTGWGC